MADGIRIEGLPKLDRILRKVGSLRPVKLGLAKGALHLSGKIREYPDAPTPSDPKRVYKRGVGMYYVPTGKQYYTSEKHSHSWTTRPDATRLTWTVGSDTSYGPYLQDKDKRTAFHRKTGWKTTDEVTDVETDDVNRLVKREVDLALQGL